MRNRNKHLKPYKDYNQKTDVDYMIDDYNLYDLFLDVTEKYEDVRVTFTHGKISKKLIQLMNDDHSTAVDYIEWDNKENMRANRYVDVWRVIWVVNREDGGDPWEIGWARLRNEQRISHQRRVKEVTKDIEEALNRIHTFVDCNLIINYKDQYCYIIKEVK